MKMDSTGYTETS